MLEQRKSLIKVLEFVADELDIPDSKFKDARDKYEVVGNWLGDATSELFKFEPRIFPQGSIQLGTCVKPLGRDEFDIDLVCQIRISSRVNQSAVYNVVGERLKRNKEYSSILEGKNRCWRLKYAGDFHMDILPAIPDGGRSNTSILVPDKELRCWESSDPEGYANWFHKRMEPVIALIEKANVEDVPEYRIKTPLQRAIQILKRNRDIVFQEDQEDKPISIIITTLSAKAYNNEANLYEALINIILGMPNQFDIVDGNVAVLNPTNQEENFAEKWRKHPQRKEKFIKWLMNLKTNIDEVVGLRGLPNIHEALIPMFGENILEGAWKRYTEENEKLRRKNILKINPKTGIIGTSGIPVKRNTFYGN